MSPLQRSYHREFEARGVSFTAQLSPCSWMYPEDGVQMQVTLQPNGGHEYIRIPRTFSACSEAEAESTVAAFRAKLLAGGLSPCPSCGSLTWSREVFPSSLRDERCEACFLTALTATASLEADLQRVIEDVDSYLKSQAGFSHAIVGWVHGKGDDQRVAIFLKCVPTREIGERLMREAGCTVGTDFQVRELPSIPTFAEAREIADRLWSTVRATGAKLQVFPKGPMGLTTDEAKQSIRFQSTMATYQLAHLALQRFNTWFTKQFRTELRAALSAKHGSTT